MTYLRKLIGWVESIGDWGPSTKLNFWANVFIAASIFHAIFNDNPWGSFALLALGMVLAIATEVCRLLEHLVDDLHKMWEPVNEEEDEVMPWTLGSPPPDIGLASGRGLQE